MSKPTVKRTAASTPRAAKAQSLTGAVGNARASKTMRRAYAVPAGGRLQLSGQWLTNAGFVVGDTYAVRKVKTGLRVTAGKAGATITASHGQAKVYVPAELLPETGHVEVRMAGNGKLTIRQAGQ